MTTNRRPIHEFSDSDNIPPFIKALVNTACSWTGYFGVGAEISYTFDLPKEQPALAELTSHQPYYIDQAHGLKVLSDKTRDLVRIAARLWESYANIKFVEKTGTAQIPIFAFNYNANSTLNISGHGMVENVYGYATQPISTLNNNQFASQMLGVGLNVEHINADHEHTVLQTIIHEFGHLLCLNHPFDGAFSVTGNDLSTAASIMNYESAYAPGNIKIIPITPMQNDIAAVQFIYGSNSEIGLGNTRFDLRHYTGAKNLPPNTATLACLPWDNGDINTLSAKGMQVDAKIKIKPNSLFKIGAAFVALPDIPIHNVIGGRGVMSVELNNRANIVDLRASKSSLIKTDPYDGNHDIVFGFAPTRDAIILQKPLPGQQFNSIQVAGGNVTLHGQQLTYGASTKIIFNENNSLLLANITADPGTFNIRYEVLKNNSPPPQGKQPVLASAKIALDKQLEQNLWAVFSEMPRKLFYDFTYAILAGALINFLTQLGSKKLKEYGCTDSQIKFIGLGIEAFLLGYLGRDVAGGAGLVVNHTLLYFEYTPRTAAYSAIAVTATINIVSDLTVTGIINNVAKTTTTVGSYCLGSRFTMWASQGINRLLSKKNVAPLEVNVAMGMRQKMA